MNRRNHRKPAIENQISWQQWQAERIAGLASFQTTAHGWAANALHRTTRAMQRELKAAGWSPDEVCRIVADVLAVARLIRDAE